MDFSLTHKRRNDGSIIVAVPRRVRVAMGAIAAAVIGSGFLADESGALRGLGIPGIAVAATTLLALFYEERWTFDPAAGVMSFRFGLLFAARTMRIPFQDIESIELETFVKGRAAGAAPVPPEDSAGGVFPSLKRIFAPKPYRSLIVHLKESNRLVVETLKAGRAERLLELGTLLADLTGRPFSES